MHRQKWWRPIAAFKAAETLRNNAKFTHFLSEKGQLITASVLQLMAFDKLESNKPWEEKLETRVFVVQAASQSVIAAVD